MVKQNISIYLETQNKMKCEKKTYIIEQINAEIHFKSSYHFSCLFEI